MEQPFNPVYLSADDAVIPKKCKFCYEFMELKQINLTVAVRQCYKCPTPLQLLDCDDIQFFHRSYRDRDKHPSAWSPHINSEEEELNQLQTWIEQSKITISKYEENSDDDASVCSSKELSKVPGNEMASGSDEMKIDDLLDEIQDRTNFTSHEGQSEWDNSAMDELEAALAKASNHKSEQDSLPFSFDDFFLPPEQPPQKPMSPPQLFSATNETDLTDPMLIEDGAALKNLTLKSPLPDSVNDVAPAVEKQVINSDAGESGKETNTAPSSSEFEITVGSETCELSENSATPPLPSSDDSVKGIEGESAERNETWSVTPIGGFDQTCEGLPMDSAKNFEGIEARSAERNETWSVTPIGGFDQTCVGLPVDSTKNFEGIEGRSAERNETWSLTQIGGFDQTCEGLPMDSAKILKNNGLENSIECNTSIDETSLPHTTYTVDETQNDSTTVDTVFVNKVLPVDDSNSILEPLPSNYLQSGSIAPFPRSAESSRTIIYEHICDCKDEHLQLSPQAESEKENQCVQLKLPDLSFSSLKGETVVEDLEEEIYPLPSEIDKIIFSPLECSQTRKSHVSAKKLSEEEHIELEDFSHVNVSEKMPESPVSKSLNDSSTSAILVTVPDDNDITPDMLGSLSGDDFPIYIEDSDGSVMPICTNSVLCLEPGMLKLQNKCDTAIVLPSKEQSYAEFSASLMDRTVVPLRLAGPDSDSAYNVVNHKQSGGSLNECDSYIVNTESDINDLTEMAGSLSVEDNMFSGPRFELCSDVDDTGPGELDAHSSPVVKYVWQPVEQYVTNPVPQSPVCVPQNLNSNICPNDLTEDGADRTSNIVVDQPLRQKGIVKHDEDDEELKAFTGAKFSLLRRKVPLLDNKQKTEEQYVNLLQAVKRELSSSTQERKEKS